MLEREEATELRLRFRGVVVGAIRVPRVGDFLNERVLRKLWNASEKMAIRGISKGR